MKIPKSLKGAAHSVNMDVLKIRKYGEDGLQEVEIPNINMFRHGTMRWFAAVTLLNGGRYVTSKDAVEYM